MDKNLDHVPTTHGAIVQASHAVPTTMSVTRVSATCCLLPFPSFLNIQEFSAANAGIPWRFPVDITNGICVIFIFCDFNCQSATAPSLKGTASDEGMLTGLVSRPTLPRIGIKKP